MEETAIYILTIGKVEALQSSISSRMIREEHNIGSIFFVPPSSFPNWTVISTFILICRETKRTKASRSTISWEDSLNSGGSKETEQRRER